MEITSFGKLTNDEVKELEDKIEVILPIDYKEFLLKNNGGKPQVKYSTFYVEELNQNISLDIIFGVGIDKLDISHWNNLFKDDILQGALIIGCDMGNGFIVLINDDENDGIYYWDHSYYFEQSSDDNNLFFVSNSFTEFVDSLQPLVE